MINWKVRFKNRMFWITFIPALLALIHVVAALFGINIDTSVVGEKLINVVDAVFLVLACLGVVVDMTTPGMSDSIRALGYSEPGKALETEPETKDE